MAFTYPIYIVVVYKRTRGLDELQVEPPCAPSFRRAQQPALAFMNALDTAIRSRFIGVGQAGHEHRVPPSFWHWPKRVREDISLFAAPMASRLGMHMHSIVHQPFPSMRSGPCVLLESRLPRDVHLRLRTRAG